MLDLVQCLCFGFSASRHVGIFVPHPHPAPEPLTEQTHKGAGGSGTRSGCGGGPFCSPVIYLGASISRRLRFQDGRARVGGNQCAPAPAQLRSEPKDTGVETFAPERGFGGDRTGQGPDLSTSWLPTSPASCWPRDFASPARFLVCKTGVLTLLSTSGCDKDEAVTEQCLVPGSWGQLERVREAGPT